MDNKDKIVSMFVAGISMRKIAEHFGNSHNTISKILKSQGYTSDFRKKLDESAIICDYNDGKSAAEIAKKLKVSNDVVLRILRINGIKTSKMADLDQDEICRLYIDDKLSTVRIAEIMDVHPDTINRRLRADDIEIRSADTCNKKYSLNETFFSKIDTEEKAYWLGFMYADGYVKSNLRDFGIALAVRDIDHLNKFKDHIEYDGPIREYDAKTSFGDTRVCRIEVASRSICADLISQGCVPRKTHNIAPPSSIPNALRRHFCRGVVDGDGYIGVYDKYATIELVGDNSLLEWIVDVGPTNLSAPQPHKSIWRIRTKSYETIEWIKWLYLDSTVSLDRKKQKADLAIERFSK